jgi:hypothetical protein
MLTILGLLFFWLMAGFFLNSLLGISLSLSFVFSGLMIGVVASLLIHENYHSG